MMQIYDDPQQIYDDLQQNYDDLQQRSDYLYSSPRVSSLISVTTIPTLLTLAGGS